MTQISVPPVRVPDPQIAHQSRITAFQAWLEARTGMHFADYESLWRFSVEDSASFWDRLREYFAIALHGEWSTVLSGSMPEARWFPGSTLNYVEQVFSHSTSERPAIVFGAEDGRLGEMSWSQLERDVGSLAAWLRRAGVRSGDRVVAYLPNIPESVVAFLAVASVGGIWSICSQEMGTVSVLDRFRQIRPKVLIAADGYVHGGKRHERAGAVGELLRELPSLERLVWVSNLHADRPPLTGKHLTLLEDALREHAALLPEQVPFDHPLWVVYSSGTTGLPKPIVHGQGGVVLEHVKLLTLHNDLTPNDRFFWFASTGWIMWNIQIGGLLAGATICLFDGSPGGPTPGSADLTTLWRFAEKAAATFFGAGAAFYASCLKADLSLAGNIDLSRLRAIGSTGSPLAPDAEQWIYRAVRPSIWVAAMSGGTDFASAFVGGLPTLPSYLGQMQCRCLGAWVEAWTEAGQPVIDTVGELVCRAPMPSMPLCFWNDPGSSRYRESYFEMFPGVWRHGDWVRIVPHPGAYGAVIYGRSDATINRHGIRMGTAELYRAVEALPEVMDSLVVDLEYLGRDPYMPLFLVLRPGYELDRALVARINSEIQKQLSPRHVPSEVIVVPEIPRTLTGKKLELPVKNLMLGGAPDRVLSRDAVANPDSIDWFIRFAEAFLSRNRA